MTQPIFWALGVASAAAFVGVSLASRFEAVTRVKEQPPVAMSVDGANPVRPAAEVFTPNAITLTADARGHFSTSADVAGRGLQMLVDTGASVCAFTYEDAERIGLRVYERDFNRRVETANGSAFAAAVRVPVIRIGSITLRDVEAIVLPRGRLSTSLLGMSFLRRLNDFKMSDGRLTMRG